MQALRTATNARSMSRIVASLALLTSLSACGFKGPLYMPPPAPPDASLTTPPTPKAAPEQAAPAAAPAATSSIK
ncbi:Putative lipoprotein OS=Eoetvoesiella caeni OX=645616 GN=DFR37_102245 PE=4 SV=1 [Eoetvoesiella caeni]|uniref:Putative lipoprotein n=2 Tax=Eoetvoesiella caeni TaxID=645616 RepID=A0A366HIW7_9BURK|nr:lipoprotein [Eoetvoesiella caeni]RBP41866.1 putative lipoprotein [Eoetvoesiella caeni]